MTAFDKSILSTFTLQLEAFNRELCKLFPDDNNLNTSLNMIILLKRTNPRKLLSAFENFAMPYKIQIINKDDTFLLTHNFKDLSQKGGNSDYAESLIKHLKVHWGEMGDKDKENTWKYFFVLFQLQAIISNQ